MIDSMILCIFPCRGHCRAQWQRQCARQWPRHFMTLSLPSALTVSLRAAMTSLPRPSMPRSLPRAMPPSVAVALLTKDDRRTLSSKQLLLANAATHHRQDIFLCPIPYAYRSLYRRHCVEKRQHLTTHIRMNNFLCALGKDCSISRI